MRRGGHWCMMISQILTGVNCRKGRLFQSMSFSFFVKLQHAWKNFTFSFTCSKYNQSPKIAWCTNIVRNEDDNVIQWLISNTTFNNGMWHVLNGFLFTKLYVNKPYLLIIFLGWTNVEFDNFFCKQSLGINF